MSIAASCNTEQTYLTSNAAILYISVNPPLQARSQCIKKRQCSTPHIGAENLDLGNDFRKLWPQ